MPVGAGRPDAPGMPEIHLHVGLPKTGTSTIQAALDARVDALAAAGVLYPGGRHRAHRVAAYDLLGQRVRGDDADVVPGAFRRLVDEATAYAGPRVLISDEELGMASPRHVRRVVRSLGPDHVHIVIGVRDMARTVVSAWQQNVLTGSTTPWRDFIGAVRDPARLDVPDATVFWLRHDVVRVLEVWATEVPPERIRLVTVPPPGSDGRVLLDRFGAATGLPAGLWEDREEPERNVALGAAEVEVVRRMNGVVRPQVNQEQHRFVVEQGLRPRLAVAQPRPIRLPDEHLAWAHDYAEGLVAELRDLGVQVFGDLSDLVPDERPRLGRPFDRVDDVELLEAAEAALAALAVGHARLFRRYRRAFREREGRLPSAAEVVGSSLRAAAFGVQKAVLRRSGANRLLARAVRRYAARTSGRR